jgi:hypothetical protein
MMTVWQKPDDLLENEKCPTPSHRYDHTAAIWLQMWMPVRQTSSNRYDASSANFMTPIKSVTGRLRIEARDQVPAVIHVIVRHWIGKGAAVPSRNDLLHPPAHEIIREIQLQPVRIRDATHVCHFH